ncbi:MAG: arsenate reductase ArsC [Candidatus Obscuribacterales bacterium]|nr:arsenate reductase ArsC [Candidatus Obscuribacterales bacterium]
MKVLFICVENSCRSQMAEGFARNIGLKAESAGVKAGSGVNPDAIKVMAEIGINISKQYSKAIDEKKLPDYDAVISMCSVKTVDFCPSTFIGTQANWNIEDPKGQTPDVFRRVRDEIKSKVEELART